MNATDFNGKAVLFKTGDSSAILNKRTLRKSIGIAVTSDEDARGAHYNHNGKTYTHIMFCFRVKNPKSVYFYRHPIEDFILTNSRVPSKLKQEVLTKIKQYSEGIGGHKYMNNLLYLEALSNIKKIQTY